MVYPGGPRPDAWREPATFAVRCGWAHGSQEAAPACRSPTYQQPLQRAQHQQHTTKGLGNWGAGGGRPLGKGMRDRRRAGTRASLQLPKRPFAQHHREQGPPRPLVREDTPSRGTHARRTAASLWGPPRASLPRPQSPLRRRRREEGGPDQGLPAWTTTNPARGRRGADHARDTRPRPRGSPPTEARSPAPAPPARQPANASDPPSSPYTCRRGRSAPTTPNRPPSRPPVQGPQGPGPPPAPPPQGCPGTSLAGGQGREPAGTQRQRGRLDRPGARGTPSLAALTTTATATSTATATAQGTQACQRFPDAREAPGARTARLRPANTAGRQCLGAGTSAARPRTRGQEGGASVRGWSKKGALPTLARPTETAASDRPHTACLAVPSVVRHVSPRPRWAQKSSLTPAGPAKHGRPACRPLLACLPPSAHKLRPTAARPLTAHPTGHARGRGKAAAAVPCLASTDHTAAPQPARPLTLTHPPRPGGRRRRPAVHWPACLHRPNFRPPPARSPAANHRHAGGRAAAAGVPAFACLHRPTAGHRQLIPCRQHTPRRGRAAACG
ncbi:basic proline-rich protein-like, partial [Penaeus indicus]|uniref:basic proline-rich protein-like n=1 Tax=Penaeus indicus TaxID=29960 RepID=UPI00300CD900